MPRIASLVSLLAVPLLAITVTSPAVGATAKSGAVCPTAGATSGTLTCTKKAGKLVWSKTAAPAKAGASAGLDGTWKPTAESKVGYRAKEVLFGQKTEGVGQTNAVTGTLTIAGSSVTAVDLSADLTKLASSESRRDAQVQGRILETAKFPTAKLKLLKPINFGKAPAEGVAVTQKGSVELTVKAVTKTVDVDVSARVKAGKIEIAGSIPLTWADWGINDPSFAGQITVEPNGLMEFIVVFAK
jgi:hypothetical protein